MKIKDIFCTVIGAVGGAIAAAFGGWVPLMSILFALNIMDYVCGMVLALVFHKSSKTESGAASSREGFKGICRKAGIWVLVLLGHFADYALGIHFLRDAIVVAFIVNEMVSVIENVGSMGVPIPAVLTKAIDALQRTATKVGQQLDEIAPERDDEKEE